jgi:glutaredoxin 3
MTAAVTMYTTSWCPYCSRARALLARKNVAFEEIDVESAPEKRAEMQNRSGRSSVPQIYIGDRHVGGCDDLHALDEAGKLDALLGR